MSSESSRKERIAVIGAGSWGTALANLLSRNGHDVMLWAYESELVREMAETGINSLYLPGIDLHSSLRFTNSLEKAASGRNMLLMVTPVQVMRAVLLQLRPFISGSAVIVNASKGIELETLEAPSSICGEIVPENAARYVTLSGPTFAREVGNGLPSLIVAASRDEQAAQCVQLAFSSDSFRVYTTNDVTGVELGGAIKNVIAIAAGICDGLGFGHNARAALITRGLAEMTRLGVAMGAQQSTFAGLSGMGDLVLTCTGDLSRNRTVGMKLGQGMKLSDILAEMRMVAEGVKSAESVYRLAQKMRVEMPIVEKVYRILYEDLHARHAVMELMGRGLKAEV